MLSTTIIIIFRSYLGHIYTSQNNRNDPFSLIWHSKYMIRLRHSLQNNSYLYQNMSGSEPLKVKSVLRGTSIFNGPEVDRVTLNIFVLARYVIWLVFLKRAARLFTYVLMSIYLSPNTNGYHFKLWSQANSWFELKLNERRLQHELHSITMTFLSVYFTVTLFIPDCSDAIDKADVIAIVSILNR